MYRHYKSNEFLLHSASDIDFLVQKLFEFQQKTVLIQISSFMNNTVMYHKLSTKLTELFPNVKIEYFKCEDRSLHKVVLFTQEKELLANELDDPYIFQELINQLEDEKSKLEEEKSALNAKLEETLFHDSLTDSYNIQLLRKDIPSLKDDTIILFNIDNFKSLNDFYGFSIGDFILQEIAKILKEEFTNATLYRFSINKFIIIRHKKYNFYALKEYLKNISEKLSYIALEYEGRAIDIYSTMASVFSSSDEKRIAKVSRALEYAKARYLHFWIYEDSMTLDQDFDKQQVMADKTRYALENDKIIPYFQAIKNNKTKEIVKYEAFARLIDEDGVVHTADSFLAVAKKIKLYEQITMRIIEKSFEIFEESQYELHLNLSIGDIMNSLIYNFILDKLQNSTIASRVTFELLEAQKVEDFSKVGEFITEVRRYGAKIAIDDFGNGYSNFAYMSQIRPDYIKIDDTLIENLEKDKNVMIVVKTIVNFTKELGIETIAEHVYTSDIDTLVNELNINYSQGFYIDQPTPNIN